MKSQIRYREAEEVDFPSLLKMGEQLWTKIKKDELATHLRNACNSNTKKVYIALTPEEEAVGFSVFSIRTDYVEGATTSPTGYLEGIYIESEFRKMGIAKNLIQQGEAWCKEKGCSQMGSAQLENNLTKQLVGLGYNNVKLRKTIAHVYFR